MNKKELFKKLCLSDNRDAVYTEYLKKSKGLIQNLEVNQDGKYNFIGFCPSKYCCESGDELNSENIAIKVGYWTPNLWKPIRKDLLKAAQTEEAYECQIIDTSCNNCIHLSRNESKCLKKGVSVVIMANTCCPHNADCFEHRKDKIVTN
jgi:hypothetical protein